MSVYVPLRMIKSLPKSLPKALPKFLSQPCIQAYQNCADEVSTIDKWLKSSNLSQNDLVTLKYRSHAYPANIDIYTRKIAALDQRISSRVAAAAAEAWGNLYDVLDHEVFTQVPCQTLPYEFRDVYRKWYADTGMSFEQLIGIFNLFRTWKSYDFSATAVPIVAARNSLVHTANAICADLESFDEAKTILLSSPLRAHSQFLAHTQNQPAHVESPKPPKHPEHASSLEVQQSLSTSHSRFHAAPNYIDGDFNK